MAEWKNYTLEEVCERIYSGGTPSTKHEEYWNGDIKWLSSGETSQRFVYDTERKITQEGVENSSTKLATKGCTVVATAGQGYTRGQASFLMTDTYMNQSVIACKANENVILPLYLYYNLDSRYEEFRLLSDGTSTRGGLSGWILKRMEIKLPPKSSQKKIIDILYSIDRKIEENKAINNNLEQQAMALFKSWFIDFEPFDRQVPKTWINGVLGDFVEIKRGGSPRPIQNFLSDSGFHWLKISDATGITSPFINEIKEYIIEAGLKKTVYLKSGSLVLSNSATPGLPKILDIDTCIHDGWLYFPSSKFSNEYLYLYFKHIRDNLIALGNGSVFTNLKTDILKNYPTYLPTEDVLKKFDGLLQPIFSMILSKTREIKRLAEIRDTLLPKLMSGELDVSDTEL